MKVFAQVRTLSIKFVGSNLECRLHNVELKIKVFAQVLTVTSKILSLKPVRS